MNGRPLIVTLQLDHESHDHFTMLRRKHFPGQLNVLDAHVTLFHQLPALEEKIKAELGNVARFGQFAVEVTEIYHTGFGVAFRLESKTLLHLHAFLSEAFYSWLTPQDRQPFRPHVTVQNKASASESKTLAAALQRDFFPFTATATGLHSWLYDNGPWEHQEFFPFHTSAILK